jgi:hypothetical protein
MQYVVPQCLFGAIAAVTTVMAAAREREACALLLLEWIAAGRSVSTVLASHHKCRFNMRRLMKLSWFVGVELGIERTDVSMILCGHACLMLPSNKLQLEGCSHGLYRVSWMVSSCLM